MHVVALQHINIIQQAAYTCNTHGVRQYLLHYILVHYVRRLLYTTVAYNQQLERCILPGGVYGNVIHGINSVRLTLQIMLYVLCHTCVHYSSICKHMPV